MGDIIREVLYLFLAALLTLGTLLIPQTVNTPEEEASITFGYPFSFVTMTSAYDGVEMSTPNPNEYSSVTYGIWGIWEHPTTFSGLYFLYSWLSIWFVLRLIVAGLGYIREH
ncbi:MAG: hypothetical protein BRC23_02100 [Parcubacteria group bacterium SW_4_49_11]|nr:MAG: hypothetical protein BRC23_02100 [Parcubacteria group bacterium SW_4_49_11]